MSTHLNDHELIDRILAHVDGQSTDKGQARGARALGRVRLGRFENRQLAARQQLFEVSIEADPVFVQVSDRGRQPGIWQGIGTELRIQTD